ncbi:hypothetical protein [Neoasaia chiangmaiensis]|nr:hypothetical protein [Neoasaia chiangmaiensis]
MTLLPVAVLTGAACCETVERTGDQVEVVLPAPRRDESNPIARTLDVVA